MEPVVKKECGARLPSYSIIQVMDKKLKEKLDSLYRTFDRAYLSSDPLEFVHKFKTRGDREITGLVASSLAYGKVLGIRRSITSVMERVGWEPRAFAANATRRETLKAFAGFKHRFNVGADVAALFWMARRMTEEAGSIGAFFVKGYSDEHANIKEALENFSVRALGLDAGFAYGGDKKISEGAGVRYFFPLPSKGSACKRLNLYLRWMVRRGDSLDFGLWRKVSPSKLIIPLDTHMARLARNIGLTKRKNAGWATAEDVTASLRKLDPADPTKYDFALTRLGILDRCPRRIDRALCEACLIREVCVL